jgi:hypothetical protein
MRKVATIASTLRLGAKIRRAVDDLYRPGASPGRGRRIAAS